MQDLGTQLRGTDERVPLLEVRRSPTPPPASPLSRASTLSIRSANFLEREETAGRIRINALRNSITFTSTSRSLLFVSFVLLPQVVAAAVLLPKYWSSEVCTNTESPLSLRVWILGDAVIKATQLLLLWSPLFLVLSRASRSNVLRALRFKRTASFAIDVFSVVWVVQGTNYFFASVSSEDEQACHAPHLFRLGEIM